MEIRQVRYAEAVARYRSFSRAAEAMFVTQQTLSQQIKRLEDEIGFAIFERSTRSVVLTQSGRIFIEQAILLLKAFDVFSHEIERLREGAEQSIRLGILPTFSHLNVLERIYFFQAHEKDVSVQVQIQKSSRLIEMLHQGSLDAAIGNLSRQQIDAMQDNYTVQVFSEDHICAVLNRKHVLAQQEAIQLFQLENQTLLLLEKGSSIRSRMESALAASHLRPARVIDCPEIHSMMGMLQSGTGIGFLSSQVAAQSIPPTLKSLPIRPEMETITALYYPKRHEKGPALAKLKEFFSQQV